MTIRFPGIILFFLLSLTASAQPPCKSNIHIGLAYPLSSNWIHAGDYTNYFSLHALLGVSAGERSFCAAGFSNVVRQDATGFIAAGFSNHILNRAEGVQLAGFVNTIRNEANGFTAAGFMNITGRVRGLQTAGFGNISTSAVNGLQAAGFVNIAAGNATAQISGFANIAEDVEGLQASGFINKAKNVNTQVGGFINIARQVSGVQIAGFINIADSNDYPIGIVNIIRNGEQNLGVTVDEALTTLVSFRSGGRVLYGILGAGVNLREEKTLYALEAGIGAHIRLSPSFRINLEGTTMTLADFEPGTHFRSSLRVLPAIRAGRLEFFAGPTINHAIFSDHKGADLVYGYLWSTDRIDHYHGIYLGATGGVQFQL